MVSEHLILQALVSGQLVLRTPIKKKSFVRYFTKTVKKMEGKVQDYVVDPSEENIHDVRTSIRRFDAAFRLLPKSIRMQPEISNVQKCARDFFRINSDIRDTDIIRLRFTRYPRQITLKYQQHFQSTLQEHREKKLEKAKKMALGLCNLEALRINPSQVVPERKKLQKRYDKIVGKLVDEIHDLFPTVAADSSKRQELHRLRKACKKLRYTLEINEPATAKTAQNLEDAVCLLEEMQKVLGEIHDSDIMLLHLARVRQNRTKSSKSKDLDYCYHNYLDLIELETRERNRLYNQFVCIFAMNTHL
jgi:CHAD domain-containing protein